jgi:hypothetical protein
LADFTHFLATVFRGRRASDFYRAAVWPSKVTTSATAALDVETTLMHKGMVIGT